MIEILAAPFAACLVLVLILCYLGLHIVMREVIFVDLALAQIAAMGAAVGVLAGFAAESYHAYLCSLGFTFVGAAVFALSRLRDQRVPQEAIIGIVYAVSSAVAVLVLSKSAVHAEEIQHMLFGHLLFVDGGQILKVAIISAAVGMVHLLLRGRFLAISRGDAAAFRPGMRVRAWDFLFYATVGLVVTSAVQIVGVLAVFSFLVAPAICAMLFFNSFAARLTAAWTLGAAGCALGLAFGAWQDFPLGMSIVAAHGALVLLACLAYALRSSAAGASGAPRG